MFITSRGQRVKIMQTISLSHSSMFVVFPANKSGLLALSLEIIDRLLCIAYQGQRIHWRLLVPPSVPPV